MSLVAAVGVVVTPQGAWDITLSLALYTDIYYTHIDTHAQKHIHIHRYMCVCMRDH